MSKHRTVVPAGGGNVLAACDHSKENGTEITYVKVSRVTQN